MGRGGGVEGQRETDLHRFFSGKVTHEGTGPLLQTLNLSKVRNLVYLLCRVRVQGSGFRSVP